MTDTIMLDLVGGAAVKAAIILAIAGLVNVSWRSASAAARHLVWTLAVTAALAIPAIGVTISRFNAPHIEVPVWTPPAPIAAQPLNADPVAPPSAPSARVTPQEKSGIGTAAPVVADDAIEFHPTPASLSEPIVTESRQIDWRSLLFPVWIAGFVLTLFPIAVAFIRIKLLARNATPVEGRWKNLIVSTHSISHLAKRVRVLESGETAMPMTWGVFRPTLLVPSRAERWPDWQCRDILLHELAHVDRRDCLTQLVAQIACAVYWFNPLTWIASHRMRVERELACDDRVINAGSRATDYASNLLDVARSLRAPSMTSHTAIAMARPSQLSGRLLAVLDKHRNRKSVNRRIAAGTSFAAIAVALPLASLTPAKAATAAATMTEEHSAPVAYSEVTSVPAEATAAFPGSPAAIVRAIQLPAIGVLKSSLDAPELKLPATTAS